MTPSEDAGEAREATADRPETSGEEPATKSAAKPTTRQRVLSVLVAAAAFSLLAFVVQRNGGIATILQVVERLGYRWPLLLVPYACTATATILTYRACLPRRGRDVPFGVLVQIERSGSALNAMLPLGDSSGNIIKIALLRHWYTSDEIVAAAAWSSLGTGIGNAFAAIGPAVAWAMGVLPGKYALVLSAISLVMTIPAASIIVLVRRGLAMRFATWLTQSRFEALRRRKDRMIAWAKHLDAHVVSAVTTRSRDFLRVVGWKLVYQVIRVGELWLVITLLGLPGGIGSALVYNAMSRTVQQVFTFVPGRMGVAEGLAAGLFSAMGWPSSEGVAMALTLRFTYVVNLFLAGSALSGTHALSTKYPPQSAEALRAARQANGGPA